MSLQSWQAAAITLQSLQFLILLLHDWIPLGPLTDVAAARRMNKPTHLLIGTAVTSVPVGWGLWRSIANFGHAYPHGLKIGLWLIYGILFIGELQSWWIPYVFGANAAKVQRFQEMFGRTHAFLPVRHGIVPNTFHFFLHVATIATLLVLTRV
jgi:hypothetical protein